MTRAGSLLLTVLMVAALAALPAVAGPGPKGGPAAPPGQGQKPVVRDAGQVYCPSRPLVSGNVIVPAGRCYMLSVLRDRTGTFLAFVPQGERVPRGQLVRLDTPAGPKLKGRLFLIPLSTGVGLVPLNTLRLVPAQISDFGSVVHFVLTGLPGPASVDVPERER